MGNKISRKEREYLKKYNADTLTVKDWQVIRSVFRTMFRKSKTAIYTKEFNKAINNISRSTDKEIFMRYYIQKQSLTKISMDMFYDELTIRAHLRRAVRHFACAYCSNFTRMFR